MSNTTLIDARYALLKFFEQESIFMFAEGHDALVKLELENQEVKSALICEAMKHFESLDMVKKFSVKGADAWVLTKPLASYDQPVSIGVETAVNIAQVVNSYCKTVNNTKDLVDPLNLRERDIRSLTYIVGILFEKEEAESKAAQK